MTLERLVVHNASSLLQVNLHRVAPFGRSHGTIQHQGEEFGYVLEGALELSVGGKTHTLTAGDSFFFQSNLPRGYRNPEDAEALVIWVNTPPTF